MTHIFNTNQDSFEGPLDLLLSLLQEKKLSISDVSLSHITQEFLSYLDKLEEIEAQELSDFLLVAAKLLLLKSHTLLPELVHDEEDIVSLEEQLKLYRRFVDASKVINAMWLDNTCQSYIHKELTPVIDSDDIIFPKNMTKQTMHEVVMKLLDRLSPIKALPKTYIDKAVSLRERVQMLRHLLQKTSSVSFRSLLQDTSSRTDIIVSFLAILELMRDRQAFINQSKPFADIIISTS